MGSPERITLPLVVDSISKTYRPHSAKPVVAVKEVSFSIAPGECMGLLGPNGAGKSTAMLCITGFYPLSGGRALIKGVDVHRHPRRARCHLGVCSQQDNLDTDFTVLNQMIRYGTFFHIPLKQGRERAIRLLERFNLLDRQNDMVESLSGGMRRRLQVARAWMSNPELLILDEPTTGLDPEMRREIWEIVGEFRRGGGAVLLSTHYMEEAERLCDRVAVIHKGEILDNAPPQVLVERHVGVAMVEEELRPGVWWKRPPNLEDVYMKLAGTRLHKGGNP